MTQASVWAGIGLSILAATSVFADTIGVPGDQPTIQDAINAAAAGDEVVVAPGTYAESIDLLGKQITVRSLSGDPSDTIIDAGTTGRVVWATSGEGPGTVLRGFTLTRGVATGSGDAGRGGGMYILNASPQVVDCVFVDNLAFTGGGIHVAGSDSLPTIVGCTFVANQTNGGFGGGMLVSDDGSATIRGCRFLGNVGSFQGGGLYIGSTVTVSDCTFSGNQASEGGAIRIFSSSPTITNCTIVGNGFGTFGGVFHNGGGASTFANCVIWDNSSQLVVFAESTLTVTTSIVQGGVPSGVIDGGGVSAADPLFVDAIGPDGERGTLDDDLRVTALSPAIDGGDNALAGGASGDVSGEPRVRNCRIDLGAYESIFFEDCNGNGIGDTCDVAPIVNPEFDQSIVGWTVLAEGDGSVSGLSDGAAVITGSDDFTLGAVTVIVQSIPADTAVVEFVLQSYESRDDGLCLRLPGTSYDFPAFVVDGVLYPLNADGTLAPPASPFDCEAVGTITNLNPPPGPVTFVVDLEALVGPGPYEVGVGVASIDSSFGPGIATIESFVATTDVPDLDGSGVPDSCECPSDVDGDGMVAFSDVLEVLSQFGPCTPGAVTEALRELEAFGFNACDGTSDGDTASTEAFFDYNASVSTSLDQEGGFAFASAEQQTRIAANGISGTGACEAGAAGCAGSAASSMSSMVVEFEIDESSPATLEASAFGGSVFLARGGTVVAQTTFTAPTIDVELELIPGAYTLEAIAFAGGGGGDPGGDGDFVVDLRVDLSAGASCPADVDFSGVVDFLDLLAILSEWGSCG